MQTSPLTTTGGGFAQNVSWRWIFWINLPFLGIGTILVTLFLKLNVKHGSFISKLREIDFVGMTLFLASTTGFLVPVTWGGVQYPWDSWRTLVPLILCGIGMIGFVMHQEYVAKNPLIRTAVFKSTSAAILFFSTIVHGIILWAILYYMPLYYQAVKGYSPILTGIALFPWTFTVAPASIATGIAIAVTGHYRWANRAGWALTTLGMGLLLLLKVHTTTVSWVFLQLVGGVGTGMLFAGMALAVQASAVPKDQAYAANMFSFFRAFGQTLGVAIGGVIFQNQMRRKMLTYPLLADMASEYSKDAAGLVEIIKEMPAGFSKEQLKESYTEALRYIWIVMLVLSALALISSWFIKPYDMNGAMDTERGFKHEQPVRDEEKKTEV